MVSAEEFAHGIDMERAVDFAEGLAAETEEERDEERLGGEFDDEDDACIGYDPAEGGGPEEEVSYRLVSCRKIKSSLTGLTGLTGFSG